MSLTSSVYTFMWYIYTGSPLEKTEFNNLKLQYFTIHIVKKKYSSEFTSLSQVVINILWLFSDFVFCLYVTRALIHSYQTLDKINSFYIIFSQQCETKCCLSERNWLFSCTVSRVWHVPVTAGLRHFTKFAGSIQRFILIHYSLIERIEYIISNRFV